MLLKRLRELDADIAEDLRALWEIKKQEISRLPLEEQPGFYLNEYLRGEKKR